MQQSASPDVACPSCGAEVRFRSPALPYVVCSYCNSIVMRGDDGLHDIGKTAVLPFDISPLQLGSRGSIGGMAFEVIGRVRWGWENGSWNEWLLQGVDGNHRWLGEAMGQFMLLGEQELDADQIRQAKSWIEGDNARLGQMWTVGSIEYSITDIKIARCLGSEGELTYPTPKNREVLSIDFRSNDGGSASLQGDLKEMDFYSGRYVDLSDLELHNLRVIDGWDLPPFAEAH
jgi:hypothetical protein